MAIGDNPLNTADVYVDRVNKLVEAAEEAAAAIENRDFGGTGGFKFAAKIREAIKNLRK